MDTYTPVTNAQFQAFVEAGGHQDLAYWSEDGWTWREQAGAEYLVFWESNGGGRWCVRTFDRYVPLKPYLPMIHVNYYEANTYCAWAGRRLPTEAEWELAASGEPTPDGQSFKALKRRHPWGNDFPSPEQANLDAAAVGAIDVRALPQGGQ